MNYYRTTANLRSRSQPGLQTDTLGEIEEGTICYQVGEIVTREDIQWIRIAAPLTTGIWTVGFSAMSFESDILLQPFYPTVTMGSPIRSPMRVTQLFAENPLTYQSLGYRGHNGLDFGTPIGTPITAIDYGRVIQARNDPPGYGKYVKIQHSWGVSLYAHLHSLHSIEGESIARGRVIGESGNSGFSTGPHLHFEIRVDPVTENGFGGRSDPLPFIDRQYCLYLPYMPDLLRSCLELAQGS